MPKEITGLSNIRRGRTTSVQPSMMFPARVLDIIINDTDNPLLFREKGEWNSIGGIFFTRIGSPVPENIGNASFAIPINPYFKSFPLKNEIIYVYALPNSSIETDTEGTAFYYFPPLNIWNSNHHNAIPSPFDGSDVPDYQKRDYQLSEGGVVRRVKDGGTEIDLGRTFIERSNIKPVQSFEGDIIHEGRWGQSLRFGSTVNNSSVPNPWSSIGTDGDPITILRNNQYDDGRDPWVPQVENINEEQSSIYLTSTQKIPINVASKNYNSFIEGLEPISPEEYSGEQIILNSGRILFNSKSDDILLSSADSINLNAVETVNIDAQEGVAVVVGAESDILLGSIDLDVVEPLVLGDTFLEDLQNLANSLIALGTAIEVTPIGSGVPFVVNAGLPPLGAQVKTSAQKIINNIENYKSKTTFTK
tara:strand:- start:1694 stop:2950 length:1257 start_codon:yes stop_codon:yes gene_type:complete